MSDETVKASICPGMGVCHLETGVQVIIPMQIEPGKIVEALEAILNAVKNNIGEGIGCSQIACMMSKDVGAMLVVSIGNDVGMPEALDALQAAAKAFVDGAGSAKTQWEMQNKDVTQVSTRESTFGVKPAKEATANDGIMPEGKWPHGLNGKRIVIFNLGNLWAFKQFFDNRELFTALLGYCNKDLYRFELKSIGASNNALKLLERNGFDYDLVEDLKGYVVWLHKSAKYAPIPKNSVAFKETANERIFLMKDLAALEEAISLGAKIYEGEISF